eukprot:gene2877-3141_t
MSAFEINNSNELKLEYLIIDSNAIIRGLGLDLYGKAKHIVTIPEVLAEIRDSKAKEQLERLPFELEFRNPSPEMCGKVANFARTTGDYAALSKTDLKLIALSCMLEKEVTGTCNLPEEVKKGVIQLSSAPQFSSTALASPEARAAKTVTSGGLSWATIARGSAAEENGGADVDILAQNPAEEVSNMSDFPPLQVSACEYTHQEIASDEIAEFRPAKENPKPDERDVHRDLGSAILLAKGEVDVHKVHSCECSCETHQEIAPDEIAQFQPVKQSRKPEERKVHRDLGSAILLNGSSFQNVQKVSEQMRQADDGSGWVNQNNFAVKAASDLWSEALTRGPISARDDRKVDKKGKAQGHVKPGKELADPSTVKVACFTTDFSMQNVLLRIGVHVVSAHGMIVRTVKKWVLRCMACYTIQGEDLTRLFCSRCGAAHLSRVAVTLDAQGGMKLHLRKDYKVDTMGMRYSLPAPGKQDRFEGELLLREDQLLSGIWRQKVVKINKDVKSAFGEDVTSDVGIQLNKHDNIRVGFGKVNPNSQKGRERRGKKKHG